MLKSGDLRLLRDWNLKIGQALSTLPELTDVTYSQGDDTRLPVDRRVVPHRHPHVDAPTGDLGEQRLLLGGQGGPVGTGCESNYRLVHPPTLACPRPCLGIRARLGVCGPLSALLVQAGTMEGNPLATRQS